MKLICAAERNLRRIERARSNNYDKKLVPLKLIHRFRVLTNSHSQSLERDICDVISYHTFTYYIVHLYCSISVGLLIIFHNSHSIYKSIDVPSFYFIELAYLEQQARYDKRLFFYEYASLSLLSCSLPFHKVFLYTLFVDNIVVRYERR